MSFVDCEDVYNTFETLTHKVLQEVWNYDVKLPFKIGKKKAILVYAYSKRSYGDDITPFFKKLGEDRKTHLNQMISSSMPAIKLN